LKLQRKIEKFSGKINFVAENLKLPLKIQIASWRATSPAEDLNFRAKN
jgi:hypothetical protein